MDEKHVADYFIIAGASENQQFNIETKPLTNSVVPITDVTVIFKGLGEQCPIGYTCVEFTPGGHSADLNNGNFKSPIINICYRRGNDKPPLVDIGVYYEDRDRVLPDVEVVYLTPYGRRASTGSRGSKLGTFITYRRAKTNNPFNQLVVVDLCVILSNKSEHPPLSFYSIKRNLNKSYYGMIGSEVFLCYKKTKLLPPSICYTPRIISRFPLQDYADFPLPDTTPLFCLPTGASIESRPTDTPLPRPITSTFVLTSDTAQKIYGSSLSFYEHFDDKLLNEDQKSRLGLMNNNQQDGRYYETFAIKSICILSRWPFFDCFEKFLWFLYKLVFKISYSDDNLLPHRKRVPLEHHISHFLLDVAFPTPQRPSVMVQLMPGTDETLTISQPFSRLPLPLTGASFISLLNYLGVDNTMNVLLFGLCEQKILLHSLNPWILTGVAEAITAILFPFHWQCPYVPLCPISLHGILNAPLPFIVGIDTKCFDNFTPPNDVICIDLNTQSIHLSELKKCLNLRILPKRAARVLRSSLEKIYQKWDRLEALKSNSSPQQRSLYNRNMLKKIELEIQETFVRFMATILKGFRSFLLPITRAPTIGATDPTSLFDFEGFLMSRDRNYGQFYQLITKTQMFTHYIEERSFVSDKNTSLAFFDDCEERLISSDNIFSDRPIKLFDKDDGLEAADRSVYIPAPEQSPSISLNNSLNINETDKDQSPTLSNNVKGKIKFGPLNSALFHRHPQLDNFPSLDKALNNSVIDGKCEDENISFSISRRTKPEVKISQKLAKKSKETPLKWSKYLVSCCYCLWFSTLPSYIIYCKSIASDSNQSDLKTVARILRYAHSTLIKMQRFEFNADEICFRVLTLLCGHYGQPALAVRVFFEMKKSGIKPNAVTYGYYNKAVLESKWPDHLSKPTTVLWTKIQNVIKGIALFKFHGRIRMERRTRQTISLIGDPCFPRADLDVVDRANSNENSLFRPTTLPINSLQDRGEKLRYSHGRHRMSLVNRSFSTYQKNFNDTNEPNFDSNSSHGKVPIHKSQSMHLRDNSPDRSSMNQADSSSLEDEEEASGQRLVSPIDGTMTKVISSTNDLFIHLKEKHQLLTESDSLGSLKEENLNLIDSMAGILFNSSQRAPSIFNISHRSSSRLNNNLIERDISCRSNDDFLLEASLNSTNLVTNASDFLKKNSFGEDAQILRNLEPREQQVSDVTSKIIDIDTDSIPGDDSKSDKLLMTDAQTPVKSNANQYEGSIPIKNVTSTPNFNLSSLINDASNLQWSKWTSSQNSKNVYKGIQKAATGFVSSLQEIKSSFSMSHSSTPSKLLSQAQTKSTTTREMLTQWANYFSSQPIKGYDDDSDNQSIRSTEMLGLSNEDDMEASAAEASEIRYANKLFAALEKHYNNSNSKEDLMIHLSDQELDGQDDTPVAIEIKLSTCSRCNVCHSLLYDEEIMENWSYNESNLNTRCIYCKAKIVPLMNISINDFRFGQNYSNNDKSSNLLIELDSDESDKNSIQMNELKSQKLEAHTSNRNDVQQLTVPYLSPIVLRKELESVFESSGDSCPSSSKFVDEHPVIFWNLLWFFHRINVPTHLASLCLNANSILAGREVSSNWKSATKIVIKTLWDNEKLHMGIERPLYRLVERGNPSMLVEAILCDEIFFKQSFLDSLIDLLRANELQKVMNLVLNARLKGCVKFSFDKNRHNLYRDLMFLIHCKLGPGKLFMDIFEREYKRAFDCLNFQQVALNIFDRPPTNGSIYCRKSFKRLSLTDSF